MGAVEAASDLLRLRGRDGQRLWILTRNRYIDMATERDKWITVLTI